MRQNFLIRMCLLLLPLLALCSCEPEGREEGDEGLGGLLTADPIEWDGTKNAEITYQLLVYSFADSDGDGIGDFQGIIDKLDYLDSLGATAMWLSPIHPAASYHGYDVKDYADVNPDYGTLEDFRALVSAAHEHDIKIYIDYVLNHSSKDHPWFLEAKENADSPYRDFYIFSDNPRADIEAGRIPMINTEGSNGYDASQWYVAGNEAVGTMEFVLDWTDPDAPTVTVTRTDGPADPENTAPDTDSDKYLYLGDPGRHVKFYDDGGGMYSLTVDFDSPWGFLIRPMNSNEWPAGSKYGAQSASEAMIEYGVPKELFTSQDNNAVADLLMPGTLYYHSHMWTSWFADLNYGAAGEAEKSPAFQELVRIGRQWVTDYGIDGMRLDAVKHIYHNANSSENPTFLGKFYDAMSEGFTGEDPFYMVGEVFSEHNEVAPYYAGLPAAFEFAFWWRLSSGINSGTGNTFVKDILSYQQEYAAVRPDYIEATKLSNHDENRAGSDLGESTAKMRLAGAVLLTAGGEPYIYYGEELGYTGVKDNGDEYVRIPMNWGDSYNTKLSSYTDKSEITLPTASVSEQAADASSVFRVYKDFARARHACPALAHGHMVRHDLYNETLTALPGLCAWIMEYEDDRVLVLHNFSGSEINFLLHDTVTGTVAVQGEVSMDSSGETPRLVMGAYSSVVFSI